MGPIHQTNILTQLTPNIEQSVRLMSVFQLTKPQDQSPNPYAHAVTIRGASSQPLQPKRDRFDIKETELIEKVLARSNSFDEMFENYLQQTKCFRFARYFFGENEFYTL